MWLAQGVDGVHDLGGMQGFGPVEMEPDEPLFHEDWERRAFLLAQSVMLSGLVADGFRYAIERMDPAWYLAAPYYERWLTSTATVLMETGEIGQQELDDHLGSAFAVARPDRAPRLPDSGSSLDQHCYRVGDRVRVRERHALGHTRAPRYVRGKAGTVARLDGVFSVPDVQNHSDGTRNEPTYSVRFEATEMWGESGDPVYVDLWESYLEAVDD
jgi:nitrile hydratase beta subunit